MLILASSATAAPERIAQKPLKRSVVFIVVDALRADRLGSGTAPALDVWASSGVIFTRAYATSNWTLPSVASIMTSMPPTAHGAIALPSALTRKHAALRLTGKFLPLADDERLDPSRITLAGILSSRGYATAAFVDGGPLKKEFGLNNGFDEYTDDCGRLANYSGRVLAWLAQHQGKPYFLYLHPSDVHDPYKPAPDWMPPDPEYSGWMGSENALRDINQGVKLPGARDLRRLAALYDGGVQAFDAALAPILIALKKGNPKDWPIVILTSDHGDGFYEHKLVRHANSPYEELLRVPLAIWAPDIMPHRSTAVVSHLDLAPTVLSLVDAPAQRSFMGTDLTTILRGGLAPNRFAYAETANSRFWRAHDADVVIGERWKYIRRIEPSAEEFYDLATDPGELAHNPEYEGAAILRASADEWRAKARAAAAAPSAFPKARIDAGLVDKLRAAGYVP